MHPISWGEFEARDADLAAQGRRRLHGRVCYLATTTAKGAPRVHPVTPVISENALYLFMEPTSPKGHDLDRRRHFALHCGVEDTSGGEGEFFVSGGARRVHDAIERKVAVDAAPYRPADRYILFELRIARAASRRYSDQGAAQQTWQVE